MVPIDTATNKRGKIIPGLGDTHEIAIAPDGKYAYVMNDNDGTVIPIDLVANTADSPVSVFTPTPVDVVGDGIAIAPDGKTLYVASHQDGTVIPIDLTSQTRREPISPGLPIHAGHGLGLAITPNGKMLYVASWDDNSVIPIATATGTPGAPIKFAGSPTSIAITPDGKTAYIAVADTVHGREPPYASTVVPLATATNKKSKPIKVGLGAIDIAITPDGRTAYVVNFGENGGAIHNAPGTVTPIDTATNTARASIAVGIAPIGLAITPDGKTVYVSNAGSIYTDATVLPISTATNKPGKHIHVYGLLNKIAIAPDQAPVAQLSVTPQPAGSGVPTGFDASASVAPSSRIVSYKWNFGDGKTATTKTPRTSHLYRDASTYQATVTETDAAGTSTKQVFTGQTMSRNGGPSAIATAKVVIVSCTNTATCAGNLEVPQTPTAPLHTIAFTGTPTSATGTVHLSVAPASVVCPNEDPSVAPVAELTDTGFDATTQLSFTTTLHDTIRADAHEVCYESDIPFLSQANPTVPTAGIALLLGCTATAGVAPCVVSIDQAGPDVVAHFVVPGGDPRFHLVKPAPLVVRIPVLPKGVLGKTFSAQFHTTGGQAPIKWKLASGKLPPGLTLNAATGGITGSPTSKGSTTFTLQSSDSLTPPQTAKMSATITIK